MRLWILLIFAFLIQEPISTSGILLIAYQQHYNVWFIHLIFCLTTIFDIVAGYYVGMAINKRFSEARLILFLKIRFQRLATFMGKNGKRAALVLFVPTIFPASGIFIPCFGISLWEATVFIFIGELIFWYGYIWLLVLGASSLAHDSHLAIYVILAFSITTSLGIRYLSREANSQ